MSAEAKADISAGAGQMSGLFSFLASLESLAASRAEDGL